MFHCLSVITLPLCSGVYNKYAGLPRCCDFSIREPRPSDPSFSVLVLSVFSSSLTALVRPDPGVMQGHSRDLSGVMTGLFLKSLLSQGDFW